MAALAKILQCMLPSSSNSNTTHCSARRKCLIFTSSLVASYFHFHQNPNLSDFPVAIAQEINELDRVVENFQVDAVRSYLKPITVGKSQELQVEQSCFAIGNPLSVDWEMEEPFKQMPVIILFHMSDDSYGHVIGVNTPTFTRNGSGTSSGVNFAIPIDTAVRIVPYLIVYGTPYTDRF